MTHTVAHRKFSIELRSALATLLLAMLAAPGLSGCAVIVKGLQAVGSAPQPAKYANLAGQTVAVVVWAEASGVRIDWPQIQLDTGQMIQSKIQIAKTTDKPKELEKTRFPISADSVAHFQEDNPDLASQSIEDIAPKLGVSRVIYVEIRHFQTRSDLSDELFRGSIGAAVKVVEIYNGKGHIAFTQDNIRVTFPKSTPEEGLPNLGDRAIYNGSLQGLATEVAKLFVPHSDDTDTDYSATIGKDK